MKTKITAAIIMLLSIFSKTSNAQQWERCPNQPNYPGLPTYISNWTLTPMGGTKMLVASGNVNTDYVLGYYTLDGGETWTTTLNVPGANIATSGKSGNYLYLGQRGGTAGNIYSSTDDGVTWTLDLAGSSGVYYFYPFNNGIAAKLDGPSNTIIKLNTSTTWTTITNYPTNASNTDFYYSNGDTLFTSDGFDVFYTIDMGQNWVLKGNILASNASVYAAIPGNNGSDVFASLSRNASGIYVNAGIARSSNGGATWDTIPFGAVTSKTARFIKYIDNEIYVGMTTGYFAPTDGLQERLYKSSDNGTTWTDLTYNLKDTFATDPYDLAKMNGVLFVTTGSSGVVKLTGTSSINSLEPTLSNLNVFPNPAKSYTVLEFNLVKAGNVTVSIVDLQGKTLQRTVSEMKNGNNKISLNTSALTLGLYIAKVEFENTIAVKKIIVE